MNRVHGRLLRPSREISIDEHQHMRERIVQTTLTSNGRVIEQDPIKFGRLRESSEHAADGTVLRERLSEDGYVFLRDVLDTQVLLRVQQIIADELHRLDAIDPDGDRAAHPFPARTRLSPDQVLA